MGINRELACRVEGEQVVYFKRHLPVFVHAKSDLASLTAKTLPLQHNETRYQRNENQGDEVVAIGSKQTVAVVIVPRRTAQHAAFFLRRVIPVFAPLPDVPSHVIQPVRV